MRKIFHSMNAVEKIGEVNLLPSRTVPDMAIPLEVLIDRYIRGIDLGEIRTPYWQEDGNYIPDPKSLDLVDIEERRIAVEESFSQLEKDVKKEKQDRAEARLQKKLDELNKKDKDEND